MNSILKKPILLFAVTAGALSLLFLACAPVEKPLDDVCPPEFNVIEAVSVLSQRWTEAQPFYANGRCLITAKDNDGKPIKENPAIKIWVLPPHKVCLYGDIFLDSKGLILGATEEEFWFVCSPREIRTYMWGKQGTAQNCSAQLPLPISPTDILDALGMIRFDLDSDEQNWNLTHAPDFDILTCRNSRANLVKKVYIARCDYRVRKIEYFDRLGKISVLAELDKYQLIEGQFLIPTVIDIKRITQENDTEEVKITLKSVKPKEFTDKQKNVFFSKPDMKRFKEIFFLSEDCSWVQK